MVKLKISVITLALSCLFCNLLFAAEVGRVKACFMQGDYRGAILEGEKLLGSNIDKQHSDELYYLLGLSYLKDGNYLRASDIFSIIINEFKDSRFKDEATVGLGDSFFLQGDLTDAKKCYSGLLKSNQSTKLKAQLYSRLSQLAFKQGDTAEGKKYADKLKSEFPLSPDSMLNNDIYTLPGKTEVYYSAQVGSFSSSVNANNLASILVKKGYPAFVEEGASKGKDRIYRVKVGKFSERKEAARINDKLIREGYPTKICP
jgi:tetratricopeptide (TPR) repeat protein